MKKLLERLMVLQGGRGDDVEAQDVDRAELIKGIQVEFEHCAGERTFTDEEIEKFLDKSVEFSDEDLHILLTSQDIAIDHLTELPDYYTRLAKMEKGE